MTRLAPGRSSHLSADEIAVEALRQFDEAGREPSIRSLAHSLGVTPRAIYHYYATRNDIIEATMALVWSEAFDDMLRELGDPLRERGDPIELFVVGARCTWRAFLRHPALTSHFGMSVRPSSVFSGVVTTMGAALEDLGLAGPQAGLAVSTYVTFVFGSIMLEASRRRNAAEAPDDAIGSPGFTIRSMLPGDAPVVDGASLDALDRAMAADRADEVRREEQFLAAVRHIVQSYVKPAATVRGAD